MVRKLFDFNSSSQPYTADAVVVCCFDARIRSITNEFLRRGGFEHPDLVIIAGGGLALSSPRTEFGRAFVLDQIQLAIRLHRASRIIVASHSDCATYGGVAAFDGDYEREMRHHVKELCSASMVIKKEVPGLLIERIFFTFDSVLSISDDDCAERSHS